MVELVLTCCAYVACLRIDGRCTFYDAEPLSSGQVSSPATFLSSRPYLKQTNDSWRVDESYVKVREKWMYLYRAVDSTGQTLDFLLNQSRSTRAAKRFFRKVLGTFHITAPQVINVDKNPTYIGAVRDLKQDNLLPKKCRQAQPVHEQHHRARLSVHQAEDQARPRVLFLPNGLADHTRI